MQQEQFSNLSGPPGISPNGQRIEPKLEAEMPLCCGTGCAVCVLDYPDLFSINQTDSGQTDCNMLELLEAVELAQAQAGKMIANGDSQ
ncbi:MAG TPA: hypothetical protein PLK30_01950 [Blastocatellia bacterium]|nr:hypothetical protein [Blastocatellia bacterium]